MRKSIFFFLFLANSMFITITSKAFDIGQRFILSLPNTKNNQDLAAWLEQTKPAGVMLEAFHVQDRAETKKLTTFLQATAKKLGLPPLIVSIDWEGGIVSRPSEMGGFFSVPSPHGLAHAGRSACFLAGKLIGQQLRSVGVNMDFAPSLDLFDADNYVLATRCFSHDPELVAQLGIAFAKGLLSEGVLPVVKHFPGLGLGKGDTHLKQVALNFDKKLFAQHALSFDQALEAGLPAVMSTHAQFGKIPATLSKKAVDYLKAKKSNVLLITDDLSMNGMHGGEKHDVAALEALIAGYHLIIFSGKPEFQKKILEAVQIKSADLPDNVQEKFEQDIELIGTCKEKFFKQDRLDQADILNEKVLSDFLAQKSFQSEHAYLYNSVQNSKNNTVVISVNLPEIRLAEKWFVNNNKSFFVNQLNMHKLAVQELILNPKKESSSQELKNFLAKLDKQKSKTIFVQTFFYGEGVWNDLQEKWLKLLKPYQDRLMIVSLGHPYEKTMVPGARIIELGSFQKPLLEHVARVLASNPLQTGADRLIANPKKYLENKKIGLLCHKCSQVRINNEYQFLPDTVHAWIKKQKSGTKLAALFSPEHGMLGTQEAAALIDSENTSKWSCPVYSLHGKHMKPTAEMLAGLDLLIIDLQEVGARCFTYISSMKLVLEAAAENNLPVLVLDRPNPISFWGKMGPRLESSCESFLGKLDVPFMHGETMGSLAREANKKIGAQLSVLECIGQQEARDYYFESQYVSPSPNLVSLDTVYVYPMTVFLEGTNYSEGRGTYHPFEQIGAPWVDGQELADTLNNKKLSGVYFEKNSFTPQIIAGMAENPKHKNTECNGVFIHVVDRSVAQPIKIAQVILETLFELYPEKSQLLKFSERYNLDLLIGTTSWRKKLMTQVS